MINLKNILKKTSNKKTKVKTKKVVKKKSKSAKTKKIPKTYILLNLFSI